MDLSRTLATFKPFDWDEAETSVCQRLFQVDAPGVAGLPWIALGEDTPEALELYRRSECPGEARGEVLDAARRNLARQDVTVREATVGELPMLVVDGSYYAAEKVLDRRFMADAHARLGSELLAVGIPRKGELLITNALAQPDRLAHFSAIVAGRYGEVNTPHPALTPTVLLVDGGEIHGVLRPRVGFEPEGDEVAELVAQKRRRESLAVAFSAGWFAVFGGAAAIFFQKWEAEYLLALALLGVPGVLWGVYRRFRTDRRALGQSSSG